jgi:glycosyltransferase involved in cell wall biosynthesis
LTRSSGGRRSAILLTPVLPEPGGSGRAIRAWGWFVELAERYDVHVIIAEALPNAAKLPAGLPARSLHSIGDAAPRTGGLWRLAGGFVPPLVLLSSRFMANWFHPMATELPDFGDVREIVVFRAYLHRLGEQVSARYPHARRVLDMDDLESATHVSIAGALWASGQRRLALRHHAIGLQYRLVERRLIAAYAETYLANPDDAARMGVAFRPNRIADPGDWPPPLRRGPLSLLFVGSLGYFPNEQAARFIIEQLVPALRETLGQPFRAVIAGRQPSTGLRALAATVPEVELVADAESLEPLYEASDIVLVPLQSGGGTKLKTLEAMARRRPVISTAEGVRGLPARAGEHYLAAETAPDFVNAIVALATGKVDAAALTQAARRLCYNGYVIG